MTLLQFNEKSVLRRITIAYGLLTLFDFLFGSVYIVVLLNKGLSPIQIGSLFGISSALSLLIEAPSGALADRFGHRKFLVAGLVIWGASLVLLAYSTMIISIGLSLAFWTSGMALQSGTFAPLLVSSAGKSDRQKLFEQLSRLTQNAKWLMSAIAAILVWSLGNVWDPTTTIMTAGIGLIFLSVVCFGMFEETHSRSRSRITTTLRNSFLWILNKQTLPLIFGSILVGFSSVGIVIAWQPILSSAGNVQMNGLILLALSLGALAGSQITKVLFERMSHRTVFALGVFLVAFGLFGATLLHSGRITGFIVAEFGFGIASVGFGALQQMHFTDENRNSMFSTLSTVTILTSIVANVAYGYLWGIFGILPATTIFATAIFTFGVAFLAFSTKCTNKANYGN